MKRAKKIFSMAVACLLTVFTLISYLPVNASAKVVVPEIEFASPPVTQYTAGDRVNFNIYAPNYGGKVQYRVVLWNDAEKTYYDLWNSGNGYPTRYYTKWQPSGKSIFTLGWIINEPGAYRITVYAKRAGIANNKTYLKAYNCDSYMQSIPFFVKSKEAVVDSILPLDDVTVMQGATPVLPSKVKAAMDDGLMKELNVTWPSVNTSTPGIQTIQGTVEGTTKKAQIRVNVTASTAVNVTSVASNNNYLVNVTLRDAVYAAPDASKFTIKSYNGVTTIPVQSVSLSNDKKTVTLTTGYMSTNSWYTLTVNSNNFNFIANQTAGNNISIAAQNVQVNVGSTAYAQVAKYPTDTTLTYSSSNTTIATVDQTTGLITGKYPGTATITVYGYKYGYAQAVTTFTVTVGATSGMYVYAADMQIGVGSQQMPNVTKYPTDLTVTYSSSNPSVASVNYYTGIVTGVAQGTATITMTATKTGYNPVYSTFLVTVAGQTMTLNTNTVRLVESGTNNGTLQSGVIDLTLTGGTFYNWSTSNYKSYITINNLPYGMDYTATYINSNAIRVTLTGSAYAHSSASSTTISIFVKKELIYNGGYDITSNLVMIEFSDYITPAAPTGPTVDDTNNTFGWINVPGYSNISEYEYRIKTGNTWGAWTPCSANPQPVGDIDIASGGMEVRIKLAANRNPGNVLASNAAFTRVDNSAPVLGQTLSIKFKNDTAAINYPINDSDEYIVPLEAIKEMVEMNLSVTDTNIDTQDVPVTITGSQTQLGVFKYIQNNNWKLTLLNPFMIDESLTLRAYFKDMSNNITAAIIKVVFEPVIVDIEDITENVTQGQPYTLPATVKAKMSDNSETNVSINWNSTVSTAQAGIFNITGTVAGYNHDVNLTLNVQPLAPTNFEVNDVNNSFRWTPVNGIANFIDYEYSINGGESWTTCTGNPQEIPNENYALGVVKVRVKATDTRPAGLILSSDAPFTKDTPVTPPPPV